MRSNLNDITRISEWRRRNVYTLCKYLMIFNLVYLTFLITYIITTYPYTFLSDCRANYHAAVTLGQIISFTDYPALGFLSGMFSYIAYDIRINIYYNRREMWHWVPLGPKAMYWFFRVAFWLSLGSSIFLSIGATLTMRRSLLTASEWTYVQGEQIQATRACAEAPSSKMPDGWVDPWTPLPPSQSSPDMSRQ